MESKRQDRAGANNDAAQYEESASVTLELDDGTVLECDVLTLYEAGGKTYIALLPLNDEGVNEDGEVFLYRFIDDEAGEPRLENIESDEEYEIASEGFDSWLDDQEYDEIISEEGE